MRQHRSDFGNSEEYYRERAPREKEDTEKTNYHQGTEKTELPDRTGKNETD